ncbi:hypothetical protein DWB61_09810 [Ancylomarina euxinus]|uniref:RteC protein n=1 Tax=Ancylomarina euxinus TaxID=2283627 RepID=A0A425Y105_9BACT|nr:RteC domain-containing protein [Ancylomarina euxinus]MCZ4693777.1 RteC domain-containing protein [Ancylomarina euxinus]MUP15143.1 hypothetical protein [Ancylomarina euxinus]RRG21566.1 hypothetical protein DWB61_09810 [Ancylomarina euxinus]
MIKDSSLMALENELSKANITFQNKNGLSKLFFNDYADSNEFKKSLDNLYDAFSNALRLTLSKLKSTDDREVHLEYVLQIFVALEEMIGENPNFINSFPLEESKEDSDSKYITIKNSDIFDLINYFNHQKDTILKSIKLIKRCRHKFTDRSKREKFYSDSWKDELREFYPFFMRFKDEMSNINTRQGRIIYLKKSRKEIAAEFSKKNMDFYGSPLNLYFEARLDCLKDLLHSPLISENTHSNIKWKASVTDFLEMALAISQSGSIQKLDGKEMPRKEFINQLSQFFNMGKISETESRIHKLISRVNNTSFLQRLIQTIDLFFVKDKN